MPTLNIIIWVTAIGILPALLWLAFWQSEDRAKPEPRNLLIRTFVLGMIAVPLVVPFQRAVSIQFPGMGIVALVLWAVIEEGFKFGAAYFGGLSSIEDDEPIDPLIYMITAALGFVVVENVLFVLNPLLQADIGTAIATGGMRFVGASLLHTVSSATIGVAMALSFYKSKKKRVLSILIGFILAVLFHSIFNLFIVNQNQLDTFITFGTVWVGVTLLLWFFERVKHANTLPKPESSL